MIKTTPKGGMKKAKRAMKILPSRMDTKIDVSQSPANTATMRNRDMFVK